MATEVHLGLDHLWVSQLLCSVTETKKQEKEQLYSISKRPTISLHATKAGI